MRGSTRSRALEVDAYAARSFERAVKAKESGFLAGEIAPVKTEEFAREGYNARGIKLSRDAKDVDHDTHIRASTAEQLAKIRPAFGGVQTGGNSSAIVDGAAAALAASGDYAKKHGKAPLARLVAGAAAGVPPEIMGIGPVPAINAVLEKAGLEALRHRPLRDQRGVRRAGDGLLRARSASTRTSSTSTAARSRSAIRSVRPACASPSRWRAN